MNLSKVVTAFLLLTVGFALGIEAQFERTEAEKKAQQGLKPCELKLINMKRYLKEVKEDPGVPEKMRKYLEERCRKLAEECSPRSRRFLKRFDDNIPNEVVSDIPSQTIMQGHRFVPIDLMLYAGDYGISGDKLKWSYSGAQELRVEFVDGFAVVEAPSPDWTGSETIIFKATDVSGNFTSDEATFTIMSKDEFRDLVGD